MYAKVIKISRIIIHVNFSCHLANNLFPLNLYMTKNRFSCTNFIVMRYLKHPCHPEYFVIYTLIFLIFITFKTPFLHNFSK